jgi:N-acetylglutamate synthase-like GNAT family acetyltransferase
MISASLESDIPRGVRGAACRDPWEVAAQFVTLRAMQGSQQKRTPFSERDFYLAEFRGRTVAFAIPGEPATSEADVGVVRQVLADLAANGTRVILLGSDESQLAVLGDVAGVDADGPGWVGKAWRQLQSHQAIGLHARPSETLPELCSRVALELGLAKLVWLGSLGLLSFANGRRRSLVDLASLPACAREAEEGGAGGVDGKSVAGLLREIEKMLAGGVSSVSACLPGDLANELFTYAGSGTFYAREGYTQVRSLGLDEFDAAEHLIERGVEEGYLLKRSEAELEVALANGFGAFVEGRYLAGIGALLPHPDDCAGEVASLYALTRFLGEGVGADIVRFAVALARRRGFTYVFACTTSPRVEAFFIRIGFRVATADELPESKWRTYEDQRSQEVICLRLDLT